MTEQEKIEQAAKKVCDEMEFIAGISRKPNDQDVIDSFKAGVAFALKELCPARMEKFSEWLRTFEALERQNGQWVIESQISDKDIVKAFIEDIKQKQDDTNTGTN